MTKAQRLARLKEKSEVQLAIEGKYTNLRIWIGYDGTIGEDKVNPPTHIWMRIDKYQEYSTPFCAEHCRFNIPDPAIEELKKYGFKTPIDHLDDILTITEKMKDRGILPW